MGLVETTIMLTSVTWPKSVRNLSKIEQFPHWVYKGAENLFLRSGRSNGAKFEDNSAPLSLDQTQNFGTDLLICYQMRAAQKRVVSNIEAKFHTFWPFPCKIKEGGENAERDDGVDPTTKPTARSRRGLPTYDVGRPNNWPTVQKRMYAQLQMAADQQTCHYSRFCWLTWRRQRTMAVDLPPSTG